MMTNDEYDGNAADADDDDVMKTTTITMKTMTIMLSMMLTVMNII